MTVTSLHPLLPLLHKLQKWSSFDDADRAAVLDLPCNVREVNPHQYIVQEGSKPLFSCVVLSGFAVRHKIAGNGGRQILSLNMSGDLVDLQNSLLDVADHNIQAL